MPNDDTAKVTCLSDFVANVSDLRKLWDRPKHKELWFRGESKRYETFLRPELYRPRTGYQLKPISTLFEIENQLYEDFKRCALQLCNEKMQDDYWDWDSYFLMQHHQAPTRLLDWSDGALIALHFALRNMPQGNDLPTNATRSLHQDETAPRVYVLEPDRLKEQLETLPEREITKQNWKTYVEKHPVYQYDVDEWEETYLPGDDENLKELPIPVIPLVLDLPHITRRVAAQRSRFVVFGADPTWLSEEFKKSDAVVREIVIESSSVQQIRSELRDNGITESVIYPDLDGLGRELRQLWEDRR